MEPQARMRLHAWGLRQHQGRGIAASALTEAYAVRRLYHDRRLTLRGAGRPDGAPVLRSGSGVRGATEMSSVGMLTSSTVRRERTRAK